MAEQSKEDKIKDMLCDRILYYLEPSSSSPGYVKTLAEAYETLFGKYQGGQSKGPDAAPEPLTVSNYAYDNDREDDRD